MDLVKFLGLIKYLCNPSSWGNIKLDPLKRDVLKKSSLKNIKYYSKFFRVYTKFEEAL